jgi:predicted permease
MLSMVYPLLLVFAGLASGYLIQLIRPSDYRKVRRKMQIFCLTVLSPLAVVGSVWVAPWRHWEMFSLPFIGLFCLILGGGAAFFLAGKLGLNRGQKVVYFICGGFSNLGSLGGLCCFMLLGEAGYALGPFYSLFERLWYYSVGFPAAQRVGSGEKGERKKVIDPIVVIVLICLAIGLILNLTVERPPFFGKLNGVIIPVNSFFLMVSIGLAMRFGPMKIHLKAGLIMWGIKGFLMPIFNLSIGLLLGLSHTANGLPLKAILIMGAMPVAFTALVPPTLYDLDLDLANTCWFITTVGLIVTIPLLSLIIPLL